MEILNRDGRATQAPATLIGVLALFACSCASQETINPELKSRIMSAHRVAIVTPDVTIMRYEHSGAGMRLGDDEAKKASDLISMVTQELSSRGFEVKTAPITKANEAQVQSAYERIGYAYNQPTLPATFDKAYLANHFSWYTNAPPTQEAAQSTPISVGQEECAAIANQAGADALVFVKFEQYKTSAGIKAAQFAKNFALNMLLFPITFPMGAIGMARVAPPLGGDAHAIAFVDGKTRDVLWDNVSPTEQGKIVFTLPSFDTFPR